MASSASSSTVFLEPNTNHGQVKIPKPKETEESEADESQEKVESEVQLPQTLVRIPTEHAPMLKQQTESTEQ
jgi:hypothetical protein